MGQLWLLVLLASQTPLWHPYVDATFDVGLRWLRGDNSFFYSIVNTTDAPETAPPLTTLQEANTTVTDGALDGRRANVSASTTPTPPVDTTRLVDPATTTGVQSQKSHSEYTFSPAPTGTTAGTLPSTTPLVIVNATRVSLDDLAVQIANVEDPVLHLTQNEDGSSSYVVVSGRLASTTAPTTEATTAVTTTAPTIGTTVPPANNTSSAPYEALLNFFRPWIFSRLFPAPETTSAAGVSSTTLPPVATTSASDLRMITRADVAVPLLTEDPTTTTLFPAEFRETEDYAVTGAPAFNGSSNSTVPSTALPSAVRPASTVDTATPVATDAAPTPRTAITPGVPMETSYENRTMSYDVTEAVTVAIATTTPMYSQPDGTTTMGTTRQPPVGDLREGTVPPSTTTEPLTSIPTINQTTEGYNSTWQLYTDDQPSYRFYYDPSQVAL